MRASHGLVLVSTLFVGVAIGLVASAVRGAVPVEDIAGDYAGNLTSNTRVIDVESESPGKEKIAATGSFLQEGFDIIGTVEVDDGDDTTFTVSGQAGNGRFYAISEAEDGTLVVFGTLKGAEGKRKIKAKGVFLGDRHYSELTVALKEQAPIVQ